MKKHFTKTTWILLILCILSFVGHLFIYPMLPDAIPIQWGSDGQVNSWGEKYMDLVLAALPMITLFLMVTLPNIDPRKENYTKHASIYNLSTAGITFLLMACSWLSTLAGLGYDVNIHTLIPLIIGVLFLALGNHMPKIRSNYFFGIKTPWTLANDDVWRKTHKMGGIIFCIMGIMFLMASFLPQVTFIPQILAPFIIGSVFFLYGYSYLLFRKIVIGK